MKEKGGGGDETREEREGEGSAGGSDGKKERREGRRLEGEMKTMRGGENGWEGR